MESKRRDQVWVRAMLRVGMVRVGRSLIELWREHVEDESGHGAGRLADSCFSCVLYERISESSIIETGLAHIAVEYIRPDSCYGLLISAGDRTQTASIM